MREAECVEVARDNGMGMLACTRAGAGRSHARGMAWNVSRETFQRRRSHARGAPLRTRTARRLPAPHSPAPHARLRADPPCVFNAPLLPKTRLRALFGRQFRILDHSSRSQRAFSPKASVSFRRAVIAVRGLDFGRSGRAVSHEAFVGAPEGPAGSFGALRAVPFAASSL